MSAITPCPTANTLQQLVQGRLDDSRCLALEEHLQRCPSCMTLVQQLAQSDPLAQALRRPPEHAQLTVLQGLDVAGLLRRYKAVCAPADTSQRDDLIQHPRDTDTFAAIPSVAGDRALPIVTGYEILDMLGRGGMGVVYKARQLALHRVVALKMILAGAHADAEELRRFRREAEAAARLQHPGIVQVFEIGEYQGLPFMALEYCAGGSLSRKLAGMPLPPREAARLTAAVADTLEAAHQKQIVHRDLKPQNVLLTESGAPKIADFGLARKLDSASVGTHTGAVVGTPSYMPPEQARGERVGPAADVYALGAVLYELLTGRPPFVGPDAMAILSQVFYKDPLRPHRLQPTVPRDLETICLKCLHKEPGQRYLAARDLAEDLRRFQAGEPIVARPAGRLERAWKWARRHPARAMVAVLVPLLALLLVVGGGVAWLWQQAEWTGEQTEALRRQEAEARHKAEQAQSTAQAALIDLNVQKKKADGLAVDLFKANTDLQKANDEIQRLLYLDRVRLAWKEYESGETLRARMLLQQCEEKHRHWEWHHLHLVLSRELATLTGHTAVVARVAFSPDGQRLVSVSADKTMKLWDTATGKEIATLAGHTSIIHHVAFSPDGQRIASAGEDTTVMLWDGTDGKALATLPGHTRGVAHVAFSPDGQRLASAGLDRTVKLWDVATGKEVITLEHQHADLGEGQFFNSAHAVFSPDGKRLASACSDKTVKIWDTATNQEIAALEGHTDLVTDLAFSPDGQRLASASADRTVKVWDVATARDVLTLKGHNWVVLQVTFSPDGQRLASSGLDGQHQPIIRHVLVKLWDATTGNEIATLGPDVRVVFGPDGHHYALTSTTTVRLWDTAATDRAEGTAVAVLGGHSGLITHVAFSPDGQFLASASADHTVKLYAIAGKELTPLRGHAGSVQHVAFSPDGERLASAGMDGVVRLWDTATGKNVATLGSHRAPVARVAFSPDGQQLATASLDKMVKLWDPDTGRETANLSGHGGAVIHVAFSANGQRLASASIDKTVRLWDAATGQEIATLGGHDEWATCAFSPNNHFLASASIGKTVKLWSGVTGKEIATLAGHSNRVVHVAFSPDSKRLASASDDKTVKLWDTTTGTAFTTLAGHTGAVTHVAFSPNGRHLASASADGTVRLWDPATGKDRAILVGHTNKVAQVAFSPDSQRLVSASGDGTLKVWDTTTGKALAHLEGRAGLGAYAVFSPDGKQIASCDVDTVVKLWNSQCNPESLEKRNRVCQEQTALWCLHKRQWFAAAFHFSELIKREPQNGDLYFQRGHAQVELKNWENAILDFTAAGRLKLPDPSPRAALAMLLLSLERPAAYRRICRELVQEFGDTADPVQAYTVVWLAVLAPGAVDDPEQLVALAQKSVQAAPDNLYFREVLAAAQFRAGNFKKTVEQLEKAVLSGNGTVGMTLLLAMAHQRLHHKDKARQCLGWAVQQVNQEAVEPNLLRLAWYELMYRRVLLREAEALINAEPFTPGIRGLTENPFK
jgi:WD40 repeat protein